MANIPKIQLPAEPIAEIGPFVINNAMTSTFLATILIIIVAFLIRRKAGVVPSRMQVAFESLLTFLLDKTIVAFGSEARARKFFPLAMTIFIFLLVANQFTLLPFVESFVVDNAAGEATQLFRTPTTDYSLPIGLTIAILLIAHLIALSMGPLKHIGNFIKVKQFFKIKSLKDLPMAFLDFFLGLLDIVGEVAKLASLSTRLFGNIFAGMVIIMIIQGLSAYSQFLAPVPFLVLSTLSGFVQAFVFAMLSILFVSSSINAVNPPADKQTN
jgi:F-type H+-transporting ATPase subunit a